jgi:hypothetical protein
MIFYSKSITYVPGQLTLAELFFPVQREERLRELKGTLQFCLGANAVFQLRQHYVLARLYTVYSIYS